MTASEEEVVVVAYFHALDRLAVSLHLIYLRQLRHLINVDGAGLVLLSSTSNKSFLVACENNLGQGNLGIEAIPGIFAVPDLLIVTNNVGFKGTAWYINN